MNLAVDTNAYSSLQNGNVPILKNMLDRAEQIVLPFIVDAELKAGFRKGLKRADNYAKLQKFENLDRVLLLWPDDLTNELYARIWSDLAKIGKPIPTNDVWIAAICVQHQLSLASNDSHFDNISRLEIIAF